LAAAGYTCGPCGAIRAAARKPVHYVPLQILLTGKVGKVSFEFLWYIPNQVRPGHRGEPDTAGHNTLDN
jgi:hypothetical protein